MREEKKKRRLDRAKITSGRGRYRDNRRTAIREHRVCDDDDYDEFACSAAIASRAASNSVTTPSVGSVKRAPLTRTRTVQSGAAIGRVFTIRRIIHIVPTTSGTNARHASLRKRFRENVYRRKKRSRKKLKKKNHRPVNGESDSVGPRARHHVQPRLPPMLRYVTLGYVGLG